MPRTIVNPSRSPEFEAAVEQVASRLVSAIRADKKAMPKFQTDDEFDKWLETKNRVQHIDDLKEKAGQIRGTLHYCEWALNKRKFVNPAEEQALLDTVDLLKPQHKKLMERAGYFIEYDMVTARDKQQPAPHVK